MRAAMRPASKAATSTVLAPEVGRAVSGRAVWPARTRPTCWDVVDVEAGEGGEVGVEREQRLGDAVGVVEGDGRGLAQAGVEAADLLGRQRVGQRLVEDVAAGALVEGLDVQHASTPLCDVCSLVGRGTQADKGASVPSGGYTTAKPGPRTKTASRVGWVASPWRPNRVPFVAWRQRPQVTLGRESGPFSHGIVGGTDIARSKTLYDARVGGIGAAIATADGWVPFGYLFKALLVTRA